MELCPRILHVLAARVLHLSKDAYCSTQQRGQQPRLMCTCSSSLVIGYSLFHTGRLRARPFSDLVSADFEPKHPICSAEASHCMATVNDRSCGCDAVTAVCLSTNRNREKVNCLKKFDPKGPQASEQLCSAPLLSKSVLEVPSKPFGAVVKFSCRNQGSTAHPDPAQAQGIPPSGRRPEGGCPPKSAQFHFWKGA